MIMSNRIGRSSRIATLAALCLGSFLLSACGRAGDPASVVAHARDLIEQGKPAEARIALKNLAEKHPDSVEARVLLAQLALDDGDVRTADLELSRVDSKRLNDAASERVRLRVDNAQGKYADVLAALDSGKLKLTTSDQAVLRAAALRGLGRSAESFEPLRAAITADPGNPELVVEMATTLAATGNLRQAVQDLDAYLSKGKIDADALRLRGELRLRGGQTAKAITDFKNALSAAPKSWPRISRIGTELLIGEALLAGGDVAATKAQIDKVNKLAPDIIGTRMLMARVALAEKRPAEAADLLQKISDIIPDSTQVQYLLIDALLQSGNAARATSVLERRIKQEPADATARRMLAEIKLRQNRPDEVLQLLADQTDASGNASGDVDGLLSVARLAKQRAGQAISELTSALASNPADAAVRSRLADAYLMSGDAGKALSVLREAKWSKPPAEAVGVELAAQLALGNDREANLLVKNLVDSPDVGVDVLLAAVDSAERAGDHDSSTRLLDRALQRDPYNEGALLRRASLEFSQQHYPATRTALTTLLQHHPEQPYARIALARVAEAEGKVPEAREALQTAVKNAPSAIEPALTLAGLELRTNRGAQAAAVIDALIAAAPKDGKAANAAGLLLLGTKHNDEARTRFSQATEQKGEVAEYWFNLGRAQLALGDKAAARDSFAASAERRPDWFEANGAAIKLNVELGAKAEARRLAEAFAEKSPRNAAAWIVVGDVASTDKRYADAAAAYARAYAIRPSAIAAARESVSRGAAGLERPDQPLLTWLDRNPGDLGVRRLLSEFYLRGNAFSDAAAQLEKIVAAAPNDVGALNNLAWALTKSDPKRAETYARRANAIDPQSPPIADTLGWLLVQSKRYAEAKPFLEQAAKGMPKEPSVQYHLAAALAGAGDKSAAKQLLDSVLSGDSQFAERAAASQLAQELSQ